MALCPSPGMKVFDCNFGLANFTKARSGLEMLSQVEADADIAGPGILVAFMVAAIASMISAFVLLIFEGDEVYSDRKHSKSRLWNGADQFLVAWSDQQLVLGIATCFAAYFSRCSPSFSNYHMNLINQWLVLSLITHTNALLVHCGYMSRRYRHVGIFRLIGVLFFVILASVILFEPHGTQWYPSVGNHSPLQVLPAPCFYQNATVVTDLSKVPGWNQVYVTSQIQFIGALALAAMAWVSAMAHIKCSRKKVISWWIRGGLFVANFIVGCMALSSTVGLRDWMHNSEYMELDQSTGNNGETEWSYGQYVTIVVTVLALFSFAEIWAVEVDEDEK